MRPSVRHRATSVLAIGVLVLGACSDSADDSAATSAPAVTTTAPDPAPTARPAEPACGAPDVTGGVTTVQIESGGVDREYRLYVPPAHDGVTPLPVVLDFHGLTSTAEQQALLSNLEGLAGVEGFIAVHPQGSRDPVTGNTFFEFGYGGTGVDDVGFVADVLDRLEATLCVDTTRIYAMGMSNGGFMSSRLACDLADRIVAIAPVAATDHPDDCAPSRPVPVLAFHGTDDTVVPFAGGESILLDLAGAAADDPQAAPLVALLSQHIADEVDEWAAANGCAQTTRSEISDEVDLVAHTGCDAPVSIYVVDGGGHTWPGSIVGRTIPTLGHTTTDIDATVLAWEFFQQFTL